MKIEPTHKLHRMSAYRLPLGVSKFLSAPLNGADRNLVFSPGRRADQHYKELVPGRASDQGNLTKLPYKQMSFDIDGNRLTLTQYSIECVVFCRLLITVGCF